MNKEILNIFRDFSEELKLLKSNTSIVKRNYFSNENFEVFFYASPDNNKKGVCISLKTDYNKMNFEVKTYGFSYRYNDSKIYIEEQNEKGSRIFFSLLTDLLSKDSLELNVNLFLDLLKQKLIEWKKFFESVKKIEATREVVLGLFGELSELKNLLIKESRITLLNWKGPERAKRDFVFDKGLIEVKATLTTNPKKIEISSAKQLELNNNKKLYLSVYELCDSEGGKTLSDLVKELSDILIGTKIQLSEFYKKLELIGCTEGFLEAANKYSFELVNHTYFFVDDKFPSITSKELDNGILDVKYSILLDVISNFKCKYKDMNLFK